MTDDRRRTVLLLGAIAGAAGIALGAWFLSRRLGDRVGAETGKSAADVLSDCYVKMREIQSHLSELGPALGAPLPDRA